MKIVVVVLVLLLGPLIYFVIWPPGGASIFTVLCENMWIHAFMWIHTFMWNYVKSRFYVNSHFYVKLCEFTDFYKFILLGKIKWIYIIAISYICLKIQISRSCIKKHFQSCLAFVRLLEIVLSYNKFSEVGFTNVFLHLRGRFELLQFKTRSEIIICK